MPKPTIQVVHRFMEMHLLPGLSQIKAMCSLPVGVSAARFVPVFLLLVGLLSGLAVQAAARTLRVGPERQMRTVREAAQAARDGDVVLIDAGRSEEHTSELQSPCNI